MSPHPSAVMVNGRLTVPVAEPQAPPATRSRRASVVLAALRLCVLLMVVAVMPYLNAIGANFAFDDEPHIRTNTAVTGGVDMWRIFATPLPPGDLYRPLTVLTYALNEQFTPAWAPAFHIVNLGLHTLVTLLVFILARRLFGSATVASIAALLFAVHPVHTEAVTNIVGRAELLAALFGLGALVATTAALDARSDGHRRACEAVSVLAFGLALLSKESALTLLVLIPLVRVAGNGVPLVRGIWGELRSGMWIPYALCAAVFLALRFHVVHALPIAPIQPLDNVLAFVPWQVRIRSALGVLWDYFGLLNVPVVLAADYSYYQVPIINTWFDPRGLAGLGLLVVAIVAALRSRRPALTFAMLFPFVALSLTSNVLFSIGTVKAERLLYLPSVGWSLVVAFVAAALLERPRYRAVTTVALVLLVAGYTARTWTRNWDWQDNRALYRSMAHSAPDSAKSRYNYGVLLQRENNDEAAVVEFQRALELYPWSEGSAFGIGLAFDRKGATAKAIEWYRKALDIDSGYDKAHNNLCRLYLSTGEFTEAQAACRDGLRYAPTDANLMKGLGEGLVAGADTERGLAVLRRALALNPDDASWQARIEELEKATPECRLPIQAFPVQH
jgi:protein O-mannosyl-transferase